MDVEQVAAMALLAMAQVKGAREPVEIARFPEGSLDPMILTQRMAKHFGVQVSYLHAPKDSPGLLIMIERGVLRGHASLLACAENYCHGYAAAIEDRSDGA